MGLIPTLAWDNFKKLQNQSHDDYMNGQLIWLRCKKFLGEFNEDYNFYNGYDSIELPVLYNFNYERTWPITQHTETGDIDRQSIQLFFSKAQLTTLGYINSNGNFDYDPGKDKFIIKGTVYHNEGDTPASPIPTADELLITLVVRPDSKATNDLIK